MLITCNNQGCFKQSDALLNPETLEVICQECHKSITNVSESMKRVLKSSGQIVRQNKRAFTLECRACRANREVVVDQNNNTLCKVCHGPIKVHESFRLAMEEVGGLQRVEVKAPTKKARKSKKAK